MQEVSSSRGGGWLKKFKEVGRERILTSRSYLRQVRPIEEVKVSWREGNKCTVNCFAILPALSTQFSLGSPLQIVIYFLDQNRMTGKFAEPRIYPFPIA
jgi:hypothetical protein